MGQYEYKVVPAPAKGRKARGLRKAEDKFAYALQDVMNEYAADGWEFLRSETLPSEERSGLTKTKTSYRSILVFRRSLNVSVTEPTPQVAESEPPKVMPTRVARPAEPKPAQTQVKTKAQNEDDFFENADLIPRASNTDNLPAALRQRAQVQSAKKDVAAE